MTTETINPIVHALIRIHERVPLSPGVRDAIRAIIQSVYSQGREDGKEAYKNSEEFEQDASEFARDQGWGEPA